MNFQWSVERYGGRECRGVGKVQRYSEGCTNEVCGMRGVGGQRGKGSEWWSEEVGLAVAKKRRPFEVWLQRRDRDTDDRYGAQRAIVKQAVKVAKRTADWRWGERLGKDFEGNKKMFRGEVKRVRKQGKRW